MRALHCQHTLHVLHGTMVSGPAGPPPDPPVWDTTPAPGPWILDTWGAYDLTVHVTSQGLTGYELETGPLPAGLAVTPEGSLEGTPSESGTFPGITVRATNAGGFAVSLPFTVQVDLVAPSWDTTPAPGPYIASIEAPYDLTQHVSGSLPMTYAWVPTSGALPAGMTVTSAGSLEGEPIEIGTFPGIQVDATNAAGSDRSLAFSVVVNAPMWDSGLQWDGGWKWDGGAAP